MCSGPRVIGCAGHDPEQQVAYLVLTHDAEDNLLAADLVFLG